MKAAKNIITAAVFAAAGIGLFHMAVDAAVWEAEHAPRPTAEQIAAWCNAGEKAACEEIEVLK